MITLQFKQDGGTYKATYISWGAATVQLERSGTGAVTVYANLPDMEAVAVSEIEGAEASVIFNAAIPAGVEVTIESGSEVTAAKML